MSSARITDDDEGKQVVTSDGDQVGIVQEVRGGTAYVDPDPNMLEQVKAKLDWGDVDEDTYPLDESNVAEVTDDEIRLR